MNITRKRILFEEDEGYSWVATYHLGYPEFDDLNDIDETKEILFHAPDFDTAVRYAQQYLRKMRTEEETSTERKSAKILSVEMH